jgi:uncharacterized Ntn-hydrolase superfamily protein
MTFSLVGRCAGTGMFGAAVTTSSIAVGARCPHAEAAVGAVLTQHRTDPRLGPLALDLLSRGFNAEEARAAIIAATPHRDWRQLAIIDRDGRTASWSGAHVGPEKAEVHGRDCAAIANIVRTTRVPGAMVAAFEREPAAPLARRLIDALIAGEAAGGEFVPVISAALLVVHREPFPYVDLRIDDHASPIEEIERLWAAYQPEADAYVVRALDPDHATHPAIIISRDQKGLP